MPFRLRLLKKKTKKNKSTDLSLGNGSITELLLMDDRKLFLTLENNWKILYTFVFFTKYRKIKFRIFKCINFRIKRSKLERSNVFLMTDRKIINSLEKDRHYKYISILELVCI